MSRSSLVTGAIALAMAALPACGHDTPAKPSDVCTYALSWTTHSFGAAGGSESLSVTTGAACTWQAASGVSWVTVPGGQHTGGGSITVTVAANADTTARSGSVTAAGLSATVSQDAAAGPPPPSCTVTLSESSQSFARAGGDGGFDVAAPAGCAWSVSTRATWIALVEPASGHGSGSGRVRYTVAVNDTGSDRHDDLAVNDRTFRVNQSGLNTATCTYTVVPTSATFHWHDEGGNISVTTADGCPWTVRSAATWLKIDGAGGRTGDDTVRISMSTYTNQTPRRGAVELRWPTSTAGQNVWVTQEGCFYALAPSTATIGAAGGRAQADVIASPSVDCMIGCPWTAASRASWIHLSKTKGAGDDVLFYTVDANTGAERTGVIEAVGHTLTVTQAAP